MVDLAHLRTTQARCVGYLEDARDLDWATPLPHLDFTIAGMCQHIAQTGFWYAIDLAARGVDLAVVEPQIKDGGKADDLIAAVDVGMSLLAAAIEVAPADARGFHPFGLADPSGFAAMACDEMLIPTPMTSPMQSVRFSSRPS